MWLFLTFISVSLLISLKSIYTFNPPPTKQLIRELPGWDGEIPVMYTGYIPIKDCEKYINYIFVEAQFEPQAAPVTLWMQGGPGSSGLFGMFTEIGPFLTNQYSIMENNTTPQLQENPYTWTKNVNFIFFESPAGVGNSFCINSCSTYNDSLTAEENFEFLITFFKHFPEFKKNDFYITGESYGGIYVPTLADQIMNNPENSINFKGVAIGNCCMGIESKGGCSYYDSQIMIDFLYRHDQISTSLYNQIKKDCKSNNFNTDTCIDYIYKVIYEAGSFTAMNLYDECPAVEKLGIFPKINENDTPCYFLSTLDTWMNLDATKQLFSTNKTWTSSQNEKDFYIWTETETFPYYEQMMQLGKKIMLYFGDIDLNVSYNGIEAWIKSHNFKKLHDRRPWNIYEPSVPWQQYSSKVSGYITQYENNFTFITVRGAGHLVPQNKPKEALELFENFIFDKAFNIYTPIESN